VRVPYLRIVHKKRDCLIDAEEAKDLARDLRKQYAYPGAVPAAVIIEGAMENENTGPVTFEPGERAALLRVIEGWLVEERQLSEGLFCLRDALLIDAGAI
jgi:hypothetical protein